MPATAVRMLVLVTSALLLIVGTVFATTISPQASIARGATPRSSSPSPAVVPGELLVRFRVAASARAATQAHVRRGATVIGRFRTIANLERVRLPAGMAVEDAVRSYASDPTVLYAEPNYRVEALATPNDPRLGELWGLNNVGQVGGTPDADIDAPEAWDITTGSASVVVAVIDTGLDYTHPDLAPNMFVNPAECPPNGIDDDFNGVVDDCHGFDAADDDGDPEAGNDRHATHVAGTIGAHGNNGMGVVGVNWDVRIMSCRFLVNGSGTIADAVKCLDYVAMMKDAGVNIVATSNSWGSPGFSQALLDAIDEQRARGILLIAAAGNNGLSTWQSFPAAYYLPNVIAVAATTRTDALASFSNFGRTIVHLGAPGDTILSTLPNGQYGLASGTSMATPHVTGVAALLKAQDPGRDWRAIRNLILAGGDTIPALADTVTSKRLNAYGAMTCAGATVERRLRPLPDEMWVTTGQPVSLSALHVTCAVPAGDVTVEVAPGGAVVLLDDGNGFDQDGGDGVYSGTWTPASSGTFTLTFAGGDVVVVHAGDGALTSPDPDDGDWYGFAIGADATSVVVGEPNDDSGATGSGAAHLLDAVTGAPIRTFLNPDPDLNDHFGAAVALAGNLVLVGVPYDDTLAEDVGTAYLFDATTGALLQTFSNPTGSAGGQFGFAVRFIDSRVLIGAPFDSTLAELSGTVFLFDAMTGALLHTFDNPEPNIGDGFGYSLATWGTKVVVGAPGDTGEAPLALTFHGLVHLLEADPSSPGFGSLVRHFGAMPEGYASDEAFGWSVATLGGDILVGDPYALTNAPPGWNGPGPAPVSGAAYVIDAATGVVKHELRIPVQKNFASFGWSIAGSGGYVFVGASEDSVVTPSGSFTNPFTGAAYLFEAATGGPVRMFSNPLGGVYDYYGYSAATTGGDFLVGAIQDDTNGVAAGMVYRVAPPAPVARSKCYKAKVAAGTAKLPQQQHMLVDDIETKLTTVQAVAQACDPASQSGTVVADPGAYLTCHKIKDVAGQAKLTALDLQALGPFGRERLTIKKARSLCVASGRDGSPISSDLDHYKCYQAKKTSGTPRFVKQTVPLSDELETKSTLVVKPVAFCAPVAVDGGSLSVPDTHLICYQIKDASGQAPFLRPTLDAASLLGSETLTTVKADTVCVPSQRLTE